MSQAGVTPLWDISRQKLRIRNNYVREFLGEFLGTAILVHYQVAGSLQFILRQPGVSSLELNLGQILGIMTAVLITGGASGAHINPCVSFGLTLVGRLSWIQLPVYILAQLLGGYVGSGFAVSLYKWTTNDFTAQIPADVFSPIRSDTPFGVLFYSEIFSACVLLMAVCALVDKRNMQVPKNLLAFLFSLIVLGISLSMGYNFGTPMNPARDLCPRLFALTMGYSIEQVMAPKNNNYDANHIWAAGFFAPFIGAALGVMVYLLFIGAHLDDAEDEVQGGQDNGNGDWRATQFIPKAQVAAAQPIYNYNSAPPPTMGPVGQESIYGGNNNNNNNNNYKMGPGQVPPGPGGYNTNPNVGYAPRDDMRHRQGY